MENLNYSHTVPFGSMAVVVSDIACVSQESKQYKFPKHKSNRKVKKWAKNRKNYRLEEVHKSFEMQGKLFVSSKTFQELKSLAE